MVDVLLRFVHISDTHINPDPNYTKSYADFTPMTGATALVRQLNALPFEPDFVLHTGDVAYDPFPDVYRAVWDVFAPLKYPIYYIAGNHDHAEALQRELLRVQNVILPYHYSFEVNGVEIVCVDSNGEAEPPAGAVSHDQLMWLRGICSKPDDHRPLVVAVHHNPLPVGVPWLDDYMRMTNGEEFHAALLPAKDRLRGVFFGHVHQNIEMLRDGILYSAVRSSWCQFQAYPGMTQTTADPGSPPGFNVVTVTKAQTFIRRHTFYL